MQKVVRPSHQQWATLCQRPLADFGQLREEVTAIVDAVRAEGDRALQKLSQHYDKSDGPLCVREPEFEEAGRCLSPELKAAMQIAADNIKRFHRAQLPSEIRVETLPGVDCWLRYLPLDRVGLYVPGGSAPLFSTALMLGLPARLAGCREIILCTPPLAGGKIAPAVLYAASLAGIGRVFRVGGAQAIAAMAFGTETVPRVDKIFGPGNQYVAMAKQIAGEFGTATDLPAGPSELLIIADSHAKPDHVAADLLAQAEHGPDSQVMLATDSSDLADKVLEETARQLLRLPRSPIAAKALESATVLVLEDIPQCIEFSNAYAPEHLQLNTTVPEQWIGQIRNAGSVFLGPWSPEAAGDYASGTNHTLPTGRAAVAYGGVTLLSFMKSITYQKLTQGGLESIAPAVALLARAEGLDGHARSATLRLAR
jgi:histidinol dehydrogenase